MPTSNVYFSRRRNFPPYGGPSFEVADLNQDGSVEIIISSLQAIHHFSTSISGIKTPYNKKGNYLFAPNPVDNQLLIQSEDSNQTIESVRIFDTNGALQISKEHFSSAVLSLDISTLKSGIYFVEVLDVQGMRILGKFIKI